MFSRLICRLIGHAQGVTRYDLGWFCPRCGGFLRSRGAGFETYKEAQRYSDRCARTAAGFGCPLVYCDMLCMSACSRRSGLDPAAGRPDSGTVPEVAR